MQNAREIVLNLTIIKGLRLFPRYKWAGSQVIRLLDRSLICWDG